MACLRRSLLSLRNVKLNKQSPAFVVTQRFFRPEPCQSGRLTDIGTRRIFSSEHDIFRESVRKFFNDKIVPYHNQWEKDGQVSRECWLQAGEAGFFGLTMPEEIGGAGGDWLSTVVLIDEQLYANCSGPGFVLHSDIVMPYFLYYGTPEQQSRLLPDMLAGRKIGAIAMTEPGAGSDLQGIRTHAKKDGDDWILNGSKVFITNGWMSDVCLVVAITDTKAKTMAKGISLFIVEGDNPGFKKGRKLDKIGFKAQDTAELFFEDCRLPADALLGGEAGLNKGFMMLMSQLPQERMIIANASIAMSEAAFEETREYVKQRKAFGKHISSLQVIQHGLAEMKTEIAASRAFIDQCNELHTNGKLNSSMASMAKYQASDLCTTVSYRCQQMYGGNGFMWEYPIAKRFVDSRLQPIYAGTNEIMKELIAREILQDP